MAENSWKTPAAIIGIVSVLVAVAGLYFAFQQNNANKQQVEIQKEKARQDSLEARRIEQEKQQKIQSQIEAIDDQLDNIKDQINACDEKIDRGRMGFSVYGRRIFDNTLPAEERDAAAQHLEYAQKLVNENLLIKDSLEHRIGELEKEKTELRKQL